jgi:hypothetical protein
VESGSSAAAYSQGSAKGETGNWVRGRESWKRGLGEEEDCDCDSDWDWRGT